MNYYLLKDVAEKGWTKGQVINLDEKESAQWVKNGTLVVGSHPPAEAQPAAVVTPPPEPADEDEEKRTRSTRR